MLITVLSGVRGDTRRYRSFHLYEQFRLAGVECLLSHITDPGLPAKMDRSDLVIFHRTAMDAYVARLIESVHRRGGLVLLDVDDLVFDLEAFDWIDSPDFQDPMRAALYKDEMRRHKDTLLACDAVIASTEFLAQQAGALGKSAWVHRNAFSLEMLALAKQAHLVRQPTAGKVIIGYASGTPTHDRDFQEAAPALRQVLLQYPQAELWLVGPLEPGSNWGSLQTHIRRQPLVPWRKLPEILAQMDINLAPLVRRNPFAQSKSEIKYMEAGLVSLPTIASPTEAYSFAIRPSQNGLLAGNDQEWAEALATLVEQAELRQGMGANAHQDVLDHYHPQVRAAQLLDTLDQIYTRLRSHTFRETMIQAAPHPVISSPEPQIRIGVEIEDRPTLAQMALYTLRHREISTLLKQIWVYFRRMLAPFFPYRKAP